MKKTLLTLLSTVAAAGILAVPAFAAPSSSGAAIAPSQRVHHVSRSTMAREHRAVARKHRHRKGGKHHGGMGKTPAATK